jgi:hypothetical protein
MQIIHISMADAPLKINDKTGKLWHFEMHRYCGPAVLDTRGEIKNTQPPAKSPFWEAVSFWAQQGEKMTDGRLCAWTQPITPKLVHLGGKNYTYENSALALKFAKS